MQKHKGGLKIVGIKKARHADPKNEQRVGQKNVLTFQAPVLMD
jgi:hypothetical protein